MKLIPLFLLIALTSSMTASSFPSFADFASRAEAGDRLSVVFLGGSLTWGAQATDPQKTSYRALVGQKLEQAYPRAHFSFHDAAIGGTGSQLAAFRLERDVLAHKPDLVFLDFTINDGPYDAPSPHRLAAYESLIRRLIQAGIPVVQVILPAKKDMQPEPVPRPLDAKHKEIGRAYGLPLADAVTRARERVREGKTTADLLWDLPEDHTHPGDAGYALYAEAAWEAFAKAVKGNVRCRLPEAMLHAPAYMNVTRNRLTQMHPLPTGWHPGKPHRNALAYDFVCSRWMDDLAIAEGQADVLHLKFLGSEALLFGEMTPRSGSYAVRVDGGEAKIHSATCKEGNMRLAQVVAEGLDPEKEHVIEIIPTLKPGEELRLESLCIAGERRDAGLLRTADSAPGSLENLQWAGGFR
ncbi:MAG: SGNH/GDSL hydrolase family protein [Chthoniobacterales bacterium]|nr:SGNH/GDSL hydrolase family protein [Chthoniobacterales bacterium]